MSTWYGTKGNDYHDFLTQGNPWSPNDYGFGDDGNDTIYGWTGNDTLDGWNGNDTLYGESGNDTLLGYNGYDKLYGGSGNDYLNGEGGYDDLYGGTGVDKLYGGNDSGAADYFYFYTGDTGDKFAGKADTIYDFHDSDQIWLKGSYSYAGNTAGPADGQYSVWQSGSDWVVTYNAFNDAGFHDIIVKGDNPLGDISFF
jgi:Ca2+-binding RTX toxin-like protein